MFGGTWALGLVAGALGATGFGAMLAAQGKLVFLAGLVAMFVVRGIGSPRDRLAWWCFAAAVGSYLAGALGFELYYRYLPFVPRPSWSDVGYMGFYPFAFAALLLMLRARVRRLTAQTWLDCLVTGLTAAALATAVALGALLRAVDGSLGMLAASIGYPVADLLLLTLLAGALVVIGRGAGACWWWLTGGLSLFVATDTLYAYQVVHGTYTPGGPLDFAWGLAFVCLGLAACHAAHGPAITSGLSATVRYVVPGICALDRAGPALPGLLDIGDAVAGILALGAVLAALARTAPHLPRRAGPGRQPPAGPHRRADRAAQPAVGVRGARPPPTAGWPTVGRSPSSCSTSTGSRRSTTRSATPSVTRCCARSDHG